MSIPHRPWWPWVTSSLGARGVLMFLGVCLAAMGLVAVLGLTLGLGLGVVVEQWPWSVVVARIGTSVATSWNTPVQVTRGGVAVVCLFLALLGWIVTRAAEQALANIRGT